ncbi:Salicylate carboxymethyltransferase-like protein [Drosera capensis]
MELRMKEGTGQHSYANNSQFQRTVITEAKPLLEESLKQLLNSAAVPKCLTIADLGCSSGPNALLLLSDIIDIIGATCQSMINQEPPELKIFLNDLPGNDFNTIFKLLSSFQESVDREKEHEVKIPYFISATPGSFFGRLFPINFLHFVHSSYSLHWLSQVPKGLIGSDRAATLNKGNIHIVLTSPPEVHEAYYEQYATDFKLFLRSRSKELVSGGRMVITSQGSTRSRAPSFSWEIFGKCLRSMASEGMIEQKTLDEFNVPTYYPTAEEIKGLVKEEGSFTIDKLETFTKTWDATDRKPALIARAKALTAAYRAITEPLITVSFGESIIDHLFRMYEEMLMEYMTKEPVEICTLAFSMTKTN